VKFSHSAVKWVPELSATVAKKAVAQGYGLTLNPVVKETVAIARSKTTI
jgi:hypothetical protein